MIGGVLYMDYEIMMSGNVKLGQLAPDFEAETTMGYIKLSDYRGKWVVFFSHARRLYSGMYNRIHSFFKSKYIFREIKHMLITD